MKKLVLFLVFLFLINGSRVFAGSNILINEIQIEPDQSIEILNTGSETKDISGWYLDDNSGTTYFTIPQNTIIYGNSCLVFTSNFNLNKTSSDTSRLFDSTAPPTSTSANLIDSHAYSTNPGENLSFFLLTDYLTWTTGTSTLGKFNTSDTSCITAPTGTSSPSPTMSSSPTPVPTINPTSAPNLTAPPLSQSYSNIYLSEIMAYPLSGEKEWVELYNDNDFPVTLTNWFIDDGENTGSLPKLFSLNITAKNYATIDLPTSMFNNDGDVARLLNPLKELKDSFEYSAAKQNETLGRIRFDNDTFCLQEPSRKEDNNVCIAAIISPTPSQRITPSPTKITTFKTSELSNKILPKTTLKSVSKQKPFPQSLINNANFVSSKHSNVPEILGTTNSQENKQTPKPLAKTLSFLSFSYSLLSMLSIGLKVRISFLG